MNKKPRIIKWEELIRSIERLREFYVNFNSDAFGSFSSPRDAAKNFFRIHYELKEELKTKSQLPKGLRGYNGKTELLVSKNPIIGLGIDIANQEKHGNITNPKTNYSIGNITVNVVRNIGENPKTEARIIIDGKREDCLDIGRKILDAWHEFLTNNKLID